MAGRASAWVIALVTLTLQVIDTHGSGLRSRRQNEVRGQILARTAAGSFLDHERLRAGVLQTMPTFDINPGTFLSVVASVQTDSLLLFFSPTCPDCEKLAPQWSRVAGLFEANRDLTILSVSDDEGKAPAPYTHDENPAVFFIRKGDSAHPIPFPMADLHEFVALPETGNTDADIVNKLVAFTRGHLTIAPNAAPQQVAPAPIAEPATSPAVALSESQMGALTARLLASLKAKETASLEDQLKIVNEPHYQSLPVVQFLKSPTGVRGPPLFLVAATYLDGLPLATQWANQYAAQQEATYRSQGWNPSPADQQKYLQDLLNYAVPLYARSIYSQRGLKA